MLLDVLDRDPLKVPKSSPVKSIPESRSKAENPEACENCRRGVICGGALKKASKDLLGWFGELVKLLDCGEEEEGVVG